MYPLLAAGGVIFWIVTAVIVLILASEIQSERSRIATGIVVAYFAAVVVFTSAGTSWFTWLYHNPRYIAYGVVGYLLGAILWTPIKWRGFFLPSLFEKYDDFRQSWLTANKVQDLSNPADKAAFQQAASKRGLDINRDRMVSHNKARITAWIAYWPFSIMGTFFGDFLTRVAYSIYRTIGSSLQRMSDGMASKYAELED